MLDSFIGYTIGTLSNPGSEDSFIGFAIGILVNSPLAGLAYVTVGEWGHDA